MRWSISLRLFVTAAVVTLSFHKIQAQQLSPFVFPTGGSSYQGIGFSLNSTIGEPVSGSFSGSNTVFTQGFQQAYTPDLQLRLFIQGFYLGNHKMIPVLSLLGLAGGSTVVDTVTVELYDTESLAPVYGSQALLDEDGYASMRVSEALLGRSFYVAIKHRNSIETWSAVPIQIAFDQYFDFSAF